MGNTIKIWVLCIAACLCNKDIQAQTGADTAALVKEFGKVAVAIEGAIQAYAEDVRARKFPTAENTYTVKD